MTDEIDKIFAIMEKSYNDYVSGKFICDRCKQERPAYRSVMFQGSPLKTITGFTRVCEHCYWGIYKELKGESK